MDLPAELFVRPVADHDDLVSFTFAFDLQGKALEDGSSPTVTEATDDSGDLIIQGWAANFDGVDREGENFTDGAFARGVKSFLEGQAALCFHHKHDMVLGKVLDLEEVEGKGLHMRARVDGAIKNHPTLGTIYEQIKNGTLNALSVGGFFKRAATALGTRIVDMDFTEISVTGVPVHSGTNFSVVAGKALEDFNTETPAPVDDDAALGAIAESLDRLEKAFDAAEGKAAPVAKGSHHDHRALATVIALHQLSQPLPDSTASDTDSNGNVPVHPKVAELGEQVRKDLHKHAKTAHALASKLGPLPADAGYHHMA
jgi:HK97 family phage prohead protease